MTSPDAPALEASHISVRFPGVRALTDVSLTVRAGEVRALLGENGAGKSTLIKVITGAQRPHSGSVRIAGQPLQTFTPRAAKDLGVRVLHQERQIARDLSVAHNVLLDDLRVGRAGVLSTRSMIKRAQQELDRFDLGIDARMPASTLTAAQQQLVELVRAVRRRSSVVILDEPTASLRRAEVEALFGLVRGLRADGCAVLYISHHLYEIFEIADTATVLRNGEKVAEHAIADTDADELLSSMFDRSVSHSRLDRPVRDRGREPVLVAEAIRIPKVLVGVDLQVRPGEILALCGDAGSGASELAEVLAGARQAGSGKVRYAGRVVRSRADAAARGIGFVPADRKKSGLLLERSIAENLLLSKRGRRSLLYWPTAVRRASRAALQRGQVRADDPQRAVMSLSGGNQQRVVFARWLVAGSQVLILDQPTAGVDVAAKFEIYRQLIELTAEGLAVLMVSSDYEETSALADRVAVMRDGRIVAELDGADATPERLYQLEMGSDVMGVPA